MMLLMNYSPVNIISNSGVEKAFGVCFERGGVKGLLHKNNDPITIQLNIYFREQKLLLY